MSMAEKKWVQHISGQGEKWVVHEDKGAVWYVFPKCLTQGNAVLPKSEYLLCSPPEQWVDVTAECKVDTLENQCSLVRNSESVTTWGGYRFRKINAKEHSVAHNMYFIVEKKVTA